MRMFDVIVIDSIVRPDYMQRFDSEMNRKEQIRIVSKHKFRTESGKSAF